MSRISRHDLFHLVRNALKFAPKADRREMQEHEALAGETSLNRVATRVCDQIDNDRRAVVQVAPDPSFPFREVDRWRG